MNRVRALVAKELRCHRGAWATWVCVGLFAELAGYFFYVLVRDHQRQRAAWLERGALAMVERMNLVDTVLGPLHSYLATLAAFLLPLLTMGLVARERRAGTFELTQGLGVRPWEFVASKLVGAWIVMVMVVGSSVPLPWMLAGWSGAGDVELATVACGYLGLLLAGSGIVALGVLFSALTDSTAVAGAATFGAVLGLLLIGQGADAGASAILEHLSMARHLEAFSRGLIRVEDLVYFVSLVTVGAVGAERAISSRAWAGP